MSPLNVRLTGCHPSFGPWTKSVNRNLGEFRRTEAYIARRYSPFKTLSVHGGARNVMRSEGFISK
jgi:hypothetical protein